VAFFALIHGGAHGGWCWEDLTPELEALGHRWSAPDLPLDDPHGASDWADAVINTVPAGAEDVIVVGHSLGGLAVPVVATRIPVRRMVFLAAMVPVPGRSYVEVMADEPDAITVPGAAEQVAGEAEPTREVDAGATMPWSMARASFYQDLPEDIARRAWRRLRSQGFTSFTERCPLATWPDVPSTYVMATEDQAVSPQWSRRIAHGRLGADLIELPGGHSPFYGRPKRLADLLHRLTPGAAARPHRRAQQP
jgi:pimeloyl-ACP methyl ester carboxylesterase